MSYMYDNPWTMAHLREYLEAIPQPTPPVQGPSGCQPLPLLEEVIGLCWFMGPRVVLLWRRGEGLLALLRPYRGGGAGRGVVGCVGIVSLIIVQAAKHQDGPTSRYDILTTGSCII